MSDDGQRSTVGGQAAGNGILDGGAIACRCGGEMRRIFGEPLHVRAGTGERIRTGDRYVYRCDACRRRLEVRWMERDCRKLAAGSGQPAGD